jgi:AcrR family transcriptional regulator
MTTMARRRLTREESKAKTRQLVVDAAYKLFRRKGFAGTSLDEIATEAGLTKGAVYSNFANKEELFLSFLNTDHGDLDALGDTSIPYDERMRQIGAKFAHDYPADPLDVALSLELKAFALRNPQLRDAWATALLIAMDSTMEAAAELLGEDSAGAPPLDREHALIAQALADGLRELRSVVPELVTEDVFGRAFQLISQDTRTSAVSPAGDPQPGRA